MYKACVIGIGQIGYTIDSNPTREFIWSHTKAYKHHPIVDLVAVSDPDNGMCDDFNKDYPQVKTYSNHLEMFNKNDIQIVSICAPTLFHLSIVKEVADYSSIRALFIEKPVGNSLEESTEIQKICDANNIILASNYMRRWDHKYQYIKEVIESRRLGNLQTIVAYGATSLLTSASHLVDLMLFFGGKTKWVIGELQEDYVRKVNDIQDHGGVAFIGFINGGHGFLKATSKNDENFMLELDILFEDGRVTIGESWDDNDQSILNIMKFQPRSSDPNGLYKTLKTISDKNTLTSNERMIDAISDIIDCIESDNNNPASNGRTAVAVHKIIRDIKQSSLTQQIIIS